MSQSTDYNHGTQTTLEVSTVEGRGVLSSMKKRMRIARTLPKIVPLNIDEIKKEIEEYELEQKQSFSLGLGTIIAQAPTETEPSGQDVLKDISNGGYQLKARSDNHSNIETPAKQNNMVWRKSANDELKTRNDKSNVITPRSRANKTMWINPVEVDGKPRNNSQYIFSTPCSKQTNIIPNNRTSENIHIEVLNPEGQRINSVNMETPWSNQGTSRKSNPTHGRDDSFDLNFSALTISTPARQPLKVLATPGDRSSGCNKGTAIIADDFVTPKVTNIRPVVPYSVSCKPVMKTSDQKSNESFANEVVPLPACNEPQEIVCTIPKVVPKDETFKKLTVKSVEYIVLSMIGKGGSSEVFQCFCLQQKQLVAIKCVSLVDKTLATGYINEVQLLQRLQHCDRIITMYDYEILEHEKKLLMVLEKGGLDLSKVLDKLAKKGGHIPMYKLIFYSMEMIYAVKQIHEQGVIHTDLKPANFIEVIDGLKLIDFGIASTVQPDMTSALKMCPEGSCNYISPEALKDTTSSPSKAAKYKVHFKSDVWSLGCIFYQLIYRRPPFHHIKNMWAKLAHIVNPNHEIEYPPLEWVPAEFITLLQKCLRYNVCERPSIQELAEQFEKWNILK